MTAPLTVADDLSRAKYELELFLLAGEFDLYEDHRFLGPVDPKHTSADVSYGKLILSCWGDEWSRSWRVVAIEMKSGRLLLQCTKQMGRTNCLLELRRGDTEDDAAPTRAEFAAKLSALIESNLTSLRVVRAIVARHDQRHLSGVHVRLILRDHEKTVAGIGTSEREMQSATDAALSAGIIWLHELRRGGSMIERLIIFVPQGRSTTIATRLTAVNLAGAMVTLFEVDEASESIEPVAAYDQGDLTDRQRRAARRALWPREQPLEAPIARQVDQIVGLAPDLIEARKIGGWVNLSIRGFEFARVSNRTGNAQFGSGEWRRRLDGETRRELEHWVADIVAYRDAAAPRRDESIYRAQAERWLEWMIRRDVTAIDPTLDTRYVYAQVPTYRGEQRTFIDLLTATRGGRLAVIELKVSEDPEFPFQGLDYWLRVEWHRQRGDFKRRGYFAGLEIADAPPLLYLVAPLFRFHATTKLIAESISDRVPVYRVGINENWRAGVRVLLSERLN
ncbi:MAG TPA: hypothetical protein VJH03_12775 [Blastocatellia bacterium]|nr:hypothetical protein [Blastocatellia bacterium]